MCQIGEGRRDGDERKIGSALFRLLAQAHKKSECDQSIGGAKHLRPDIDRVEEEKRSHECKENDITGVAAAKPEKTEIIESAAPTCEDGERGKLIGGRNEIGPIGPKTVQ